jgi:hypothetical protein
MARLERETKMLHELVQRYHTTFKYFKGKNLSLMRVWEGGRKEMMESSRPKSLIVHERLCGNKVDINREYSEASSPEYHS